MKRDVLGIVLLFALVFFGIWLCGCATYYYDPYPPCGNMQNVSDYCVAQIENYSDAGYIVNHPPLFP